MAPADPSLAVYLTHRGALLNYASGIVGDRAQAEDVVQEAYIRFSSASGEGRRSGTIGNPVAYLYRVVRNVALDLMRRPLPEALSPAASNRIEAVPHNAPTAEDVVLFRDELRVLAEALGELPARTRLAFTLYRLEGLTLQQVAGRLGVSVVRAHQLVKDAMRHGARRLDEHCD